MCGINHTIKQHGGWKRDEMERDPHYQPNGTECNLVVVHQLNCWPAHFMHDLISHLIQTKADMLRSKRTRKKFNSCMCKCALSLQDDRRIIQLSSSPPLSIPRVNHSLPETYTSFLSFPLCTLLFISPNIIKTLCFLL